MLRGPWAAPKVAARTLAAWAAHKVAVRTPVAWVVRKVAVRTPAAWAVRKAAVRVPAAWTAKAAVPLQAAAPEGNRRLECLRPVPAVRPVLGFRIPVLARRAQAKVAPAAAHPVMRNPTDFLRRAALRKTTASLPARVVAPRDRAAPRAAAKLAVALAVAPAVKGVARQARCRMRAVFRVQAVCPAVMRVRPPVVCPAVPGCLVSRVDRLAVMVPPDRRLRVAMARADYPPPGAAQAACLRPEAPMRAVLAAARTARPEAIRAAHQAHMAGAARAAVR